MLEAKRDELREEKDNGKEGKKEIRGDWTLTGQQFVQHDCVLVKLNYSAYFSVTFDSLFSISNAVAVLQIKR